MRVPRAGSMVSTARGPSLAAMALAGAALAGCFSDRGVAIEVDIGDTGARTVELYLGAQACDPQANTAGITCTSIAPPPDGKLALPGHVWFRDALAPEVAEVKPDGKAVFQLQADPTTTLPRVIAVGKLPGPEGDVGVGTATLHDVTVPANGARVITTTLAAATPAVPGAARRPGDHVLFWSKATPPSSCVMIEHGDTSPVTRDFVVPADDPDCDSIGTPAMPECNPAAYDGTSMVPGARDRPGCFTSSGGPACVLGAFGCADTLPGTDSTCSPLASRTCVPQGFCGGSCNRYDETCMRAELAGAAPPVARIECTVPTMLALGNIGLCPNRVQATIDLGAPFAQVSGGKCPDPQIAALPGIAFDSHQSFGGATMKLSSATRPCQFTLTWTDGARPKQTGMDDAGILRFPSDTSPTLLLPIVFHFLPPADSCITTEFTCSYAGDPRDSMFTACAP